MLIFINGNCLSVDCVDLEDSSEIYLPGECSKNLHLAPPKSRRPTALQAEEVLAAYVQMFVPLLIHILGAGNRINGADATCPIYINLWLRLL